jgi:thiol-disulfide isomerase/thioredoxin
MTIIRYWVGIVFIVISNCYSQTTISGRFLQLSIDVLDSASVLIKEGTGDTTYARAMVSKDGSFYLKTDHNGTLMAEFACPKYKTLQVALLCNEPTSLTVSVSLKKQSDTLNMSELAFRDSLSLLAKYALLHLKSDHRMERYTEENRKLRSEGRQGEQTIDWTDDIKEIGKAFVNEKEPILRQEMIMQYDELLALGASSVSEDSLKKWILEIPPTSPAWVYHMNLAEVLSLMYHPKGIQYVNEIIAQHANKFFRARMLYELASMARVSENIERLDSLITELDQHYPNTKWSIKSHLLIPVIHVGDPVPHFKLRSIDDSSTIFSDKGMLGRLYLIDFWATWCGPCIGEMPYLHKAYERFKGAGFTILSVSNDNSIETVSMYRKRNWAMPWLNALESSQSNGSLHLSFGIFGIPFPVLVDKKGIVIALDNDLKGENLELTLQKFIGK